MSKAKKPINKSSSVPAKKSTSSSNKGKFHIEFKNAAQKMAWAGFQQHDILFISGSAGVGKSFLAMAFAISEVLQGNKEKIILTRPVVEAGEKLGFLPGSFEEKIGPYMTPLYQCIEKLTEKDSPQRAIVQQAIEVAPIAYMRGVTFDNAVCIFDEAQNATMMQLKLFLTRIGENCKMIVNGDPSQSDLNTRDVALVEVIEKLHSIPGIGVLKFKDEDIVRNPIISKIIEKLGTC